MTIKSAELYKVVSDHLAAKTLKKSPVYRPGSPTPSKIFETGSQGHPLPASPTPVGYITLEIPDT